MQTVNHEKTNDDVYRMFYQITQRVSATIIHESQITTRAKNRHKRKQGK